jgi:hypothetical protein
LGIGGIGAEKHEGGLMREGIYSGDLIERDEWKKIPATLKDGEHIEIKLTEQAFEYFTPDRLLEITVYDAQGNSYKSSGVREFDTRWGFIRKKK